METIDLCGNAWTLSRADGKDEGGLLPAQVPGCVHTDLLAAGRIADPFYRDNETGVLWVSETDWTYARSFTVTPELLRCRNVVLRCEGLDTLAEVRLNGRSLGTTDNMFRAWEFDVRGTLSAGENRIEVRFSSPLPFMAAREKVRHMPAYNGPVEIPGRGWLRKQPSSFGWDWGPVLPSAGIWRPLRLVGWDGARLADVHVRQDHGVSGRVRLHVQVEVQGSEPGLVVAASASLDGKEVASAKVALAMEASAMGAPANVASTKGAPANGGSRGAALEVELEIREPRLWWPNGMGEHPLYTVRVDLVDGSGTVRDTRALRVGLRTLRLDRHPDPWGESFQFVVNGVPFFAKGANWIPADAFVTRLTRARYGDLLASARDANMNMLRLWGGGIYEPDEFYDLCDEMGLCLWHDFMFACSAYPGFDGDFLANVREEAEQQVRRVRHHASVALWCGNNEIEQAWVGDEWTAATMNWKDYDALFERLLPDVIRRLDPERDYWPCSPHTPVGDRKDFNNPGSGDAHLWAVWHGRLPFEWYRTCEHRFNSEFGFQSFPGPRTVGEFTMEEDRNVTTAVMEHHQRSGIGNSVIMQYMLDWFRLPGDFSMTLHLSQVLQGMAMKYAVEHWRRSMPRGMGTLYWQLNDCWPVASWSSLDWKGRWKALHYMARAFYAPLLVSGVEDPARGVVDVHVTSDLGWPVRGEVAWTITDLDGIGLAQGTIPVSVGPRQSAAVGTFCLGPLAKKPGPRGLVTWLELLVDGRTVSSNMVLFARPKHLALRDPGLKAVVHEKRPGSTSCSHEVVVSARTPALWTWLELDDVEARLSDNYVHVRPGAPVVITVTAEEPLDADSVRRALSVHSLRDTYR